MKLIRILPHLAAVAAVVLCARLALWQFDRAEEKQALLDQWETAAAADISGEQLPELFAPVQARGQFDTRRHVLLDNQTRNNHPGVHVFTPFQPEQSEQIFMVNRGWHPWNRRDGDLPAVSTPDEPITLSGRFSDIPRVGLQLGQASALDGDTWPNLMTYYDTDRIREALGPNVVDGVLLLDPDHDAHLSGDPWPTVNMGPEQHQGYAFQWISIGLAIITLWVVLVIRGWRKS